MFQKNKKHLQKPLFSTVASLPEKQKKRLEASWAQTFYEDVFCRIEEATFEILYSDQVSRPNTAVNILLGAEILKAGHDWTDREMYDQICYNLQVRYALGIHGFEEVPFELRTVYNFRHRVAEYMRETGENLIEACFEQITAEQLIAYEVSSGTQRVDSKQISSNIREGSRLQLLLETIRRIWQMMRVDDKKEWHDQFEPYIKRSVSKYLYGLKGEKHRPHIEGIGELMGRLVTELADSYGEEKEYEILVRVFGDHFKVQGEEVVTKENDELSADSLQSVDDLEATYRRKQGESYVGYVANVAETVREEKDGLQLITKVQVASNTTEDAALLAEALPDLAERTDLERLYTDGAYCGPEVDQLLHEHDVTQIPTAIRGASPDPERFSVNSLRFTFDREGTPTHAFCPHGHPLDIELGRNPDRYIVRVSADHCAICHHQLQQQNGREDDQPVPLYFSKEKAHVAQRRHNLAEFLTQGTNPRAAIEATVRELTCRLQRPKLRVRGLFRVTMTLLASAAMCNLRRIWKYQQTDLFQTESLPHFCSDALVHELFAAIFPVLPDFGLDLLWWQFQTLFRHVLAGEPVAF